MKPKREKTKFPLVKFKWLFLVSSIVIVAAVMSFGLVAGVGLGLRTENALVMLFVIPPMEIAMGMCTFVILKSVRKKLDVLLLGIEEVSKGNLDVCLDTKNADEYTAVFEDFNRMVKELKATKEEMQNFVNEFSHEFKTPITSICGFARYLTETGKDVESPERMKYLKIIESESTRLSELSQNTLTLSKVEACQIITDKESFDLSEQIKHCVILLLSKIEEKNINLELSLPDKIKYFGSEEILEQVWINLLNNAIKFTPENGDIAISAAVNENNISVEISDNGIGMDEETLSHIFEKYYQGAGSRKGGGSGIGLSIVQRIVTLCNGEIKVKSAPNEGSTFTVYLPEREE